MEQIRLKSNYLVNAVSATFERATAQAIDPNAKLTGLIGPRGVGKTTILLQQAKKLYGLDPQALYITMGDMYLAGDSLRDFAVRYRSKGGRHLFIDDVHKLPQWSIELKAIFDTLPDLKVTFAGSSTIEMVKHYTSLSQRAVIHNITTLSFREYLQMRGIATISPIDLSTLLRNHFEIATELTKDFTPLIHFNDFLTQGSYPFVTNGYEHFKRKLEALLSETAEEDMIYLDGYDPRNTYKIKQLLSIISTSVPFKPNLVKISEEIGVHRNTLIGYFFHLERTKLISLIYPEGSNVSILQKPERVYFSNANIAHLLCNVSPSRDTLAKTFAFNQLSTLHPVKLGKRDTLIVDSSWHLGISTSQKSPRKTSSNPDSYTLVDGIEFGTGNHLPLWMVGLCY